LDINLFSKIIKKLGKTGIEDFAYQYQDKIYGFKDVGDNIWDNQGKYQYKYEQGQLIEMDKNIKKYNYLILVFHVLYKEVVHIFQIIIMNIILMNFLKLKKY
jgi:hypothetical protein